MNIEFYLKEIQIAKNQGMNHYTESTTQPLTTEVKDILSDLGFTIEEGKTFLPAKKDIIDKRLLNTKAADLYFELNPIQPVTMPTVIRW